MWNNINSSTYIFNIFVFIKSQKKKKKCVLILNRDFRTKVFNILNDLWPNFMLIIWCSSIFISENLKFQFSIQTSFILLFISKTLLITSNDQKQLPKGVRKKSCSENMQQIYRRTPMAKCDFNKIALQLHWNRTSAWVCSCKFAAYFQNTFF